MRRPSLPAARAAARAALLATAAASAACADKADDSGGAPAAPATFEAVRAELAPSCGFSSCHGPPGAALFVVDDGTQESDWIDVPSTQDPTWTLVVPGQPDQSLLVAKLEGAAGIPGEPMPPPSGGVNAATIDLVRRWIAGLDAAR